LCRPGEGIYDVWLAAKDLVDVNDYIVVRKEDGSSNFHDEHVVELRCGSVTVKALAWLNRKYVEMLMGDSARITTAKLVEVLMEFLDRCI
jgi:hypothetical protein